MNKLTYIAIALILVTYSLNAQEIKKDTVCILWDKNYVATAEVSKRYEDFLKTHSHSYIPEHDFTIYCTSSAIIRSNDLQINDIGLFKNKQEQDSLVLSIPKAELNYKIRKLDDLFVLINDIYIKKRMLDNVIFYVTDKDEFESKDIVRLYNCNLIRAYDY